MAKKIEEAEVKKECPSCGLGVSLDSKICEFCGWDFEEEDEWILQIEKLERELMLEKQKFEPGSVEQKIEATLYTPSQVQVEQPREEPEEAPVVPEETVVQKPVRKVAGSPAPPQKKIVAQPAPPREPSTAPETTAKQDVRVSAVREAPQPSRKEMPVRKVRTAKPVQQLASPPAEEPDTQEGAKTKKVRVVRKVKK